MHRGASPCGPDRRRLLAGAVALLVGALVLLPAPGPAPGTSAPGALRVLPLGASSTVGEGSPGSAGYRLLLRERLAARGIRIDYVGSRASGPPELADDDHEGRSGWTAARMSPFTGGWVLAARPDVVLLHAGTNDLLYGMSPRTTAGNLDRLLGRVFAAAPRTHVVMAGVWAPLPRHRAERAELAGYLAGVAARHRAGGHSVDYVDVGGLFPESRTADGLHAGPLAYRAIAEMWAGRIEAWLRRPV